ncbi:2-oxo acid dehydrogenase subunit E2 [Paenibacillus andongensis]|uniref:2-oxo acid dehydrogenase subunit E2 n=1 Tax=Paenibacillus andongensis TaxID=2975482 RepID=UPI0021BAA9AD|nr:2-oxo acid dehydrogenase subunit E2 [Paenibacillus andongensis]
MQRSSENPHAWMMIEVDVSNIVALRQELKDDFMRREGIPLSLSPFVLKPIVNALKEFPLLNSTWHSGSILVKKDINLSIVVAISHDTVATPVIYHADHKSIAGIAIELYELVKRARSGSLQPSDFVEASFTFSNTGSVGSLLSCPIIHNQQAAILTLESIVRKPVVIQEMIAIRSIANLCLSYDYRIADGLICSRFMQRVKYYLEQYNQETIIY